LGKVVIYGAGQLGVMAADILGQGQDMTVVGFIDDDPCQAGREYDGLPVLGDASLLPQLRGQGVDGAIVCIGNNSVRGRVARRLVVMGFELVTAIDPTARVSPKARLGTGGMVATGAIIALHSVLGDNFYLGPGAVVSHDVTVGNNVLLSVGSVVAARVDIADEAFIGAGARIVPATMSPGVRLRVGENSVVGAGAVVLQDVPANAIVVGVPARVVRYRQPQETPA